MRPQDAARLLVLSALWGGSFIFMRVAAPSLGAIVTAEARVAIAGLLLLAYAFATKKNLEWSERWRQYFVIGLVNSAVPFALISWAEISVDASLAAILNATSPLFGAVIASVWLKEEISFRKVAGILVALAGVALLVGWNPSSSGNMLAVGACLLAAAFYGLGATYTRAKAKGVPAMGVAAGSQFGASLFLLPLVPFTIPSRPPTLPAIACVLALAVLSTTFAYVIYFRLIADIGPTKALSVTFLAPIFGVTWGAIFLAEAITPLQIGAMAVVLAGTALVTLPKRTAAIL